MIADPAALAPRLEALVGSARVTTTSVARWAVDGVAPKLAVRPADAEQVSAVLRICGEAGAAVIPWGGGTAIEIGNVPKAADVVLLTDRLSRLVDHDHSNLTVTAQAGITLEALGRALAEQRQFLPLEPPRAEAASAGGTAAVNLNGPRRMFYGGVRDLVIGIRVIQPDGTPIKWGGKTVKNVAGYDMCKLFVGSLGTLGIITELTFKVFPVPEVARTIAIGGAGVDVLVSIAMTVLASPLAPVAVTLQCMPTAMLLVRVEGIEAAVARHERDVTTWAAAAGAVVQTLEGEAEAGAWRSMRDFGWDGNAIAVRLSTPAAAVPAVLERLRGILPAGAGLAAHLGSGVTWVRLDAATPSAEVFTALKDLAVRHHGHLLYARVPRGLKSDTDVWFPAAGGLDVMRALKRAFDPRGTMNPGRFVAAL